MHNQLFQLSKPDCTINRIKSKGLSTHLWGTPVHSMEYDVLLQTQSNTSLKFCFYYKIFFKFNYFPKIYIYFNQTDVVKIKTGRKKEDSRNLYNGLTVWLCLHICSCCEMFSFCNKQDQIQDTRCPNACEEWRLDCIIQTYRGATVRSFSETGLCWFKCKYVRTNSTLPFVSAA